MITPSDFYHVMTAVVPLYVAMILAYGSVKWWRIFTPDQCSGINRFVALFAVPLLSFHFISSNDPYSMNLRFLAADTLQKVLLLAALSLWSLLSPNGSIDWTATLFSLSTLPNTLVMGIPLLKGMYGDFSGKLMVQIVVLQCIIWYTLMLFMFEYRAARILITEQFPGGAAASIASIAVDSDVLSLDGRHDMIETEAEIKGDGKLHVTVRRSNASRSDMFSRRSVGISGATPRASNLTNAEIYSLQSSRNPTPRGSSFNHSDFYCMAGRSSNFTTGDAYKGGVTTPRPSNYEEEQVASAAAKSRFHHQQAAAAGSYPAPNPAVFSPPATAGQKNKANGQMHLLKADQEGAGKDLHMFVWSSSASPVSDVFCNSHEYVFPAADSSSPAVKDVRVAVSPGKVLRGRREPQERDDYFEREEFSLANSAAMDVGDEEEMHETDKGGRSTAMPPASVMTRLILIMVWRKLIRNPNTYSSLIGLTWSLVSFRFVHGPATKDHSMWELSSSFCHGREISSRTSCDGGRFHCGRSSWSPAPCRYCTGGSPSRDRALRIRQGVRCASRHPQHCGYIWDAHCTAHNTCVLHFARPINPTHPAREEATAAPAPLVELRHRTRSRGGGGRRRVSNGNMIASPSPHVKKS